MYEVWHRIAKGHPESTRETKEKDTCRADKHWPVIGIHHHKSQPLRANPAFRPPRVRKRHVQQLVIDVGDRHPMIGVNAVPAVRHRLAALAGTAGRPTRRRTRRRELVDIGG